MARFRYPKWVKATDVIAILGLVSMQLPQLRKQLRWLRNSIDFVESCLQVNPAARMAAKDLLQHSFFH